MFKQKFWLIAFAIYQLFSVILISTGIWPLWAGYIALLLQIIAIFAFDLEYAFYSAIITIPFYLAVPNPRFDTLAAWRFDFLILFLVWYYRTRKNGEKIKFAPWDKYAAWFAVAAVVSLGVAQFKFQGLRQIFFLVNLYFLYIVGRNVIRSKEQIKRAIAATFASAAAIVLIGYIQLFVTFFAYIYYFWQYWAVMISKTYYGLTLADTLTYSNTWFNIVPGQPWSLRMFSILPDSHAFAVVAMFSIPFAGALLFWAEKRWQKIWLWIYIALADLAIILSGTRGVWAGVLGPVIVMAYLYFKHYGRKVLKPIFIPIVLLFVLFAVSPLFQKAVNAVEGHKAGTENVLKRAASIYDVTESSNALRLKIWGQTLLYIAKHPLLGSGYGNFIVTLEQPEAVSSASSYQSLASQKSNSFNLPKKYITAHNLYLDILAQTGLIGFAAFVLYLYSIFSSYWKFFAKKYLFDKDGFVFFAVSAALYLVWMFSYSVVDGTLLNDRVMMYFFILLALSAIIIEIYGKEDA